MPPPPTRGQREESEFKEKWNFPSELEGTVVKSIKELQEKIPTNGTFKTPYLYSNAEVPNEGKFSEGYKVYARNTFDGKTTYVAYQPNCCESIIIGHPIIKLVEPEGSAATDAIPTAGNESHIYFNCKECKHTLYHKEI